MDNKLSINKEGNASSFLINRSSYNIKYMKIFLIHKLIIT